MPLPDLPSYYESLVENSAAEQPATSKKSYRILFSIKVAGNDTSNSLIQMVNNDTMKPEYSFIPPKFSRSKSECEETPIFHGPSSSKIAIIAGVTGHIRIIDPRGSRTADTQLPNIVPQVLTPEHSLNHIRIKVLVDHSPIKPEKLFWTFSGQEERRGDSVFSILTLLSCGNKLVAKLFVRNEIEWDIKKKGASSQQIGELETYFPITINENSAFFNILNVSALCCVVFWNGFRKSTKKRSRSNSLITDFASFLL